jgi:biopolymer transport protein ExbD
VIGSFHDESASRPMSDINVTPLVDVMLVLLIVFIVTAPLFTHSIKIDLPRAQTQVNQEKPDTVTLAVDAAGRFFWNNEPVGRGELSRRIGDAAGRAPQPELHIRADRETRYQVLADVMAEAQRAKLQRVGFVTDPDGRNEAAK